MWGDEPQLEAFRERLKVLLEAHEQDLNPQVITAEEGTVLCRQGEPVDTLMLLRKGRVAVDLHQGPLVHTPPRLMRWSYSARWAFSPMGSTTPICGW